MSEKLAYRLMDAAEAIGVSKRTIERMIEKGQLEARQNNGIRLIPAEALRGYLSSLPRVPPRQSRPVMKQGAALPCEPVKENPTARARIIDREIQPTTVCMPSGIEFPGDLASGKPVYLASHPTNYPTARMSFVDAACRIGALVTAQIQEDRL